jgi:peptidoglycan/LPS O-acetylase OafA/YrhL
MGKLLSIYALVVSLLSVGIGALVVLYGPANRLEDAHHLIGLGVILFVLLAIPGSFKGGRRNGR